MYLEQVEIHGFKSFGDAVKLKIPKGITGVIGPNGSGKSNVSDAIRWVLGEQSAKSLRGSKMEDIIFAGTEKRKSLGYAEVALTIKNPDQKVAIDFTEIVVKRRVYRSGESEYFINGSACRLKDVQELFMDTGVGREGYSIIGQGQIDRVLSSKPEERRTLFEEAAGIYKYKIRRLEAEKKLEKQRENLTRLQDIIGEIEMRLEPLSQDAEKTKKFLALKQELKEVDLNLFVYEIERLEEEIKAVCQKIQDAAETLNEKENAYTEFMAQIEAVKTKRSTLYKTSEALIEQIAQLEKEKEKKQSQIALNKEKITSTQRLLTQMNLDQKEEQQDFKARQEKLGLLETKRTALELEKASQEDIITQEEEKIREAVAQVNALLNSLDESKKVLHQKLREIDLFEADIEKNDGMEGQLAYRKEQLKDQISMLNSDIQHQEVSIRLLKKNQNEGRSQLETLNEQIKEQLGSQQSQALKKIELEKKLTQITQNKVQTERQVKWLKHIKAENEGFYGSVKSVLSLVQKEPQKWQGIRGVVGELLEVPKAYEIAILTALGGAIQNIVASSEADAKAMITEMKQKGIGRVTFLPLDTMKSGYLIKEADLAQKEGFLGIASELVGYEKQYENIMSSLLGRILIVDNMTHASQIAKAYHYKYKIVTLEGEVFNSGGSLSGGSMKQQANNIFSRARELKEAQEKLLSLQNDEASVQNILEGERHKLEVLEAALEENQVLCTRLSDADKNFGLELEKNEHALKLTKANQLQLINERNHIDETLEEIEKGKQEAREKLLSLKADFKSHEHEVSSIEQTLEKKRILQEDLEKALTEKKISLSGTMQNMTYLLEQIKELNTVLEHHDEKKERTEQQIAIYKEEILNLEAHITNISERIEEDSVQIKESYEKRKMYDAQKEAVAQEESKLEMQATQMKEQIDLMKEETYRLESKKENSMLQKQNLGNSLWEQYELTYTHALPFKKEAINLSEYKKTELTLKAQIKQMGSVNANAVEEYIEAQKRYDFLTGQREDIEKAAQSLEEMIAQLMEEMTEIFRAQFALIAKNFTEVFKELFGGGEAYLELVDEENILESGIEIIAKPPGKKLQNMTLLSGGERTLTAISLIFGILKLKPSPFCVLDEIEAALDDANVIRFADYLEKLSQETQFIVITHRKGTMERAHTLYGVTMQERGVSMILSIQLEDVDHYIDQKKTS